MSTLLHLSFRVSDPQRSAELYAELLDGKVVGSGPVLNPVGVKTVVWGNWEAGRLDDIMEFWPKDKHWADGDFVDNTPGQSQHFGHLAFSTSKSLDELAQIAKKYEVQIRQEERGLPHLVPVVYDYEGNFVEFFSEEDRLPDRSKK